MKSYDNLKKWSRETESLLKRVEKEVHSVVPGAEIILYGSRAREDSGSTSDWDFLILVDQPLDQNLVTELKDRLYDLELMTDTVLTVTTGLLLCHFHRYRILPLTSSSFSSIELFQLYFL